MATNALYISAGDNDQQIHFDPIPLVGISVAPKLNKGGYYSDEYTITLNGYILNIDNIQQPLNSPPPPFTPINTGKVFEAQNNLRKRLSESPLKIQLNDPNGSQNLEFTNARLESIEFEEGTFFQYCRWSAVIKADGESGKEQFDISDQGVEDFNMELSISPSTENRFCYVDGQGNPKADIYYSVSRTISAVGITNPSGYGFYGLEGGAVSRAFNYLDAYKNSNDFKSQIVSNSGIFAFIIPSTNNNEEGESPNSSSFVVKNLTESSQVDYSSGSVTLTQECVVAPSGSTATEDFSISTSASTDNPYYKVSIEGTITGLVDDLDDPSVCPESEAETAYNNISNSGNFGINCDIYKRANSASEVNLNSQPLSISISKSSKGEITYNVEFDNRPTNFFSNVMSERIEVNDTYPGDVFATIPILGRPTGPILQYTFGRTEYKRELSLEVILDHTWIGYNTSNTNSTENLRGSYLYTKPSMRSAFRGQLSSLINTISPANEPGVRRYFLSPPRETWNPKEGRYTLNLEWTYEISE
jgi:hypothetical protein